MTRKPVAVYCVLGEGLPTSRTVTQGTRLKQHCSVSKTVQLMSEWLAWLSQSPDQNPTGNLWLYSPGPPSNQPRLSM